MTTHLTTQQLDAASSNQVWVVAVSEVEGVWEACEDVYFSFEDALEEIREQLAENPKVEVRVVQVLLDPSSALRLGMTLQEAIEAEKLGELMAASDMPPDQEAIAYDEGLEKAQEVVGEILGRGEGD